VKKPEPVADVEVPFGPADSSSVVLGTYVATEPKEPSILLQMGPADKAEWKRLTENAAIVSNRPLISLPTCMSDILLKRGLRLTLWGASPEIWPNPLVLESMAELHPHDLLDLDLTLKRGRIALHNTKDKPALVRIRFDNPALGKQEFFDVTLQDKEAEILIEHMAFFPRTEPFFENPKGANRVGPTVQLACIASAGSVRIKTNELSFAMNTALQGTALMMWSSDKGILGPLPFPRPEWATPGVPAKGIDLKLRAGLLKARDNLALKLPKTAVEVAVSEMIEAEDNPARRLAVRCLAAFDDLPSLTDALERENAPQLRLEAIESLRYWIAQGRDNDYKLHEQLKTKYKNIVAKKIMDLLHSISETQAREPVTYEALIDDLDNPVLPLRDLSYYHLVRLVPAGRAIPFATSSDQKTRQAMRSQWRQLVPRGQVPAAAALAPKKT
jgi:hypothetical protein